MTFYKILIHVKNSKKKKILYHFFRNFFSLFSIQLSENFHAENLELFQIHCNLFINLKGLSSSPTSGDFSPRSLVSMLYTGKLIFAFALKTSFELKSEVFQYLISNHLTSLEVNSISRLPKKA